MASKKTFLMYQSWASAIEKMTDEQAGQLLKAIYALQEDPDTAPEDPALSFVFEIIKEKMAEDAEAYEEVCRAKSEAGKKGNEVRWGKKVSQKVADATDESQSIAKIADATNLSQTSQMIANVADMKGYDTDTDSDTESDTDMRGYDNKKHPPYPPRRGRKFSPPSVEEVEAYCEEHGYDVDPEEFVDFYTSKGWKVGKNPMKDWKAAVRTWARRDRASPKDTPKESINDYLLRRIRETEAEEAAL